MSFCFIINLPSRTRGEDIRHTIDTYFKANDFKQKLFRGLCTGVASAMFGHSSGVYGYVKSIAPDCTFMHCMRHHEALPSRTLGPGMMKMQRHVIKLVSTKKI